LFLRISEYRSPVTTVSVQEEKRKAAEVRTDQDSCDSKKKRRAEEDGEVPQSTVQDVWDAASQMTSSFWDHFQWSPFHVEGTTKLLLSICALIKAHNNVDPPPNRQRAVTPEFLNLLIKDSYKNYPKDSIHHHAADLLGGGFFFAMHVCEFTQASKPGKTKLCVAKHVTTFRDNDRSIVPHHGIYLTHKATLVATVFADQKNCRNLDARTQ
jgi:hypothetical protein